MCLILTGHITIVVVVVRPLVVESMYVSFFHIYCKSALIHYAKQRWNQRPDGYSSNHFNSQVILTKSFKKSIMPSLGPEHRRWEALLKLVRFFFFLLFRLFEGLFEGFNMLKKLGNFAEN